MDDVAIRIEGLGKQYKIGQRERYKTLRDSLISAFTAPFHSMRAALQSASVPTSRCADNDTIWALRDVSFEVLRGEVVGIIGRNGAGKSTLLKILSRITEPTEGCVKICGRVASMLEVGTGFHPELTGRENIFLNGSVLGMRRHEIHKKLDEIINFAGVENFIETPVKHYSTGMQMRLAFAVAAHLEAEVLLVDEVLAVGDAAFQKKCLAKMDEVSSDHGRTVLFVSHNLATMISLCSKAHWLDGGRLTLSGPADSVVNEYWKATITQDGTFALDQRTDRAGTGWLRATEVILEDLDRTRLSSARCGQGIRFVIRYTGFLDENFGEVTVRLGIVNSWGERLIICWNELVGTEFRNLPRNGALVCALPKLPLFPGHYEMNIILFANRQLADKVQRAASFQVVEGDFFGNGQLLTAAGVPVEQVWSYEEGD